MWWLCRTELPLNSSDVNRGTLIAVCVVGLLIGGCVSVPSSYIGQIPSDPASEFQAASEPVPIRGPNAVSDERHALPPVIATNGPVALADCIRIALERNPRTRSTWQAARAEAARVGEERAAYLPSLDIDAQATHGKSVSLDSEIEREVRDTYAVGLDVSYLLLDGGARRARVQSAEAGLLAADFRHNTTLQEVALAVAESYYERLGAKWLLKVADETVRRTQYQLEMVRARHKAGMVTRSDVLRAETQRAEAELLQVQARNGVKIAQGRLARNMGLPVNTAFEIAEAPADVQRTELPRIEQLLDEAARHRPELKTALAGIEQRRAELAGARAASWPTLSATGSAGRRDTDLPPEEDEWSVGLSLGFSLFDGFERSHRRGRAQAELARALAEHADLLQGIEMDVWNAYWRLIEAGESMDAAAALTASASESARLAEGEYKSGVTSIVGLIDAQTARTEAERRLVQSRLDWYTAKAGFERAAGRSLAQKTSPVAWEKGK